MQKKSQILIENAIGESYAQIAQENLNSMSARLVELMSQRRLPDKGWSDLLIEDLLLEIAKMDTNNYENKAGVGEREGRVYSNLVAKRNYYLGHGIGRSGTVNALQPKAPGSSLLLLLCKYLVMDAIKRCSGIQFAKDCLILPSATGIAITLTLLALKQKNTDAKYVIWPRIDQKTCLKSITSAGLEPIVIENAREGDSLITDIEKVKASINEYGASNILCILSTTSCFAPRVPDKIEELSIICKENNIYHVVNNAYGLQCQKISNWLNQGHSKGRVDAVIQSTDKNYLVPVGGSIIFSPSTKLISHISNTYPGRASSSPIIDLLITLLSMGKDGLQKLYKERKENLIYFREKIKEFCESSGDRLLETPNNSISLAIYIEPTISRLKMSCDPTSLGAFLFKRRIMGARVVAESSETSVGSNKFLNYGSHSNDGFGLPYVNVACSVGCSRSDIEKFLSKLS